MEAVDVLELLKAGESARGLEAFVAESNRIEGIHLEPTPEEIRAHREFIARKRVKVQHVQALVAVCQPNAVLRATTDIHGVRVGNHVAPPSGPKIVADLDLLLRRIASDALTPWSAHVAYETLHPFTDCNGRSGRMLWLWTMGGVFGAQLGFLHHWYYASLQENR